MKTVFWDMIPCNQMDLTDVLEKYTALVSRDEKVRSFETSIQFYQTTQYHTSEDSFFFFQSYDWLNVLFIIRL